MTIPTYKWIKNFPNLIFPNSKQGDLLLVSWTNGGELEKDRRRLFEELISTRE